MNSKFWTLSNSRKLTSSYLNKNFPENVLPFNTIHKHKTPTTDDNETDQSHLNDYPKCSAFKDNHIKHKAKRFSKIDATQSNFEIKPKKNIQKSLSVSNVDMLQKQQLKDSNNSTEIEKKLFKFNKDDPTKVLFQKCIKILSIKDTRPETLIMDYFNEIKTDLIQKYNTMLDKVNAKENEIADKIKDQLLREIKIASESCILSVNTFQREKMTSLILNLRSICKRISESKINEYEILLVEEDFLKEFELFKSDILLNKSMLFIKFKTKGAENEIKKDAFILQPFYFGTMILADFYLSSFDISLLK